MPSKKKAGVMASKRPKLSCEVCGEKDKSTLHRHHITERTELYTTNDDMNLAIICGNCHAKVHDGSIEIIGVFPGTKPPTGRILVFKENGICNVPGLEEPYFTPKPQGTKIREK